MLAYLVAVYFAAAAVAAPEPQTSLVSRSALSAMSVNDAKKTCDQKHLVCCDKTDECSEVDFEKIERSDFLYEHCTTTVLCCDFETKLEDTKNWGDIYNECNYVGSLAH